MITGPESRGGSDIFVPHQRVPAMAGVFNALGISLNDVRDIDSAVAVTQPWVRGDHGHDSYDFGDFSWQQVGELSEAYVGLDMVEQRDLISGDEDIWAVYGAVDLGNMKRLEYVKNMLDQGMRPKRIVLLGGERGVFPEREPEDLAASIKSIEEQGLADKWLDNAKQRLEIAVSQGNRRIFTETDMLRIASIQHLGPMVVERARLNIGLEDTARTSTPINEYEFRAKDGIPVSLMHFRAQPRKDGDWRHTTESCTVGLARYFGLRYGQSMAVIGAKPHLDRMVLTVDRSLREAGYDGIRLTSGGPGTTEQTGHSIYLGEVARWLWEVQQLVKAGLIDSGDARMMRQSAVPRLGTLAAFH